MLLSHHVAALRRLVLPCRRAPTRRSLRAAAASLAAPSAIAEGTEVDVVCDAVASNGRGVCRTASAFVLFVPFALPGEALRCRVDRVHARYGDATRVATLSPPPAQRSAQPLCPHFGDCGGCAWQHLAYDAQLEAKAAHVSDAFRRIARLQLAAAGADGNAPEDGPPALLPAVGAPPHARYRYRNKVSFAVAPSPSGGVVIGLQREGRAAVAEGAAALVPVGACAIQHPAADAVLATARAAAERHPDAAAALRRLTLRTAADDSLPAGARVQMELGALPGGASRAAMAAFAADVAGVHPELVSVVLSQEAPPAAAASAGGRRAAAGAAAAAASAASAASVTLHGDERLEMSLGGLRFRVSARAFFQVNPACAELLLDAVRAAAALAPGEAVLDLFCGTGALGLCLVAGDKTGVADARGADATTLLRGWDVCAAAVADAAANAALNGVPASRAAFTALDLARGGLAAALRGPDAPRVVVLDPARAGLTPPLVAELRSAAAQRLVYVSCNPSTQARDVAALCAPGGQGRPYRLRWVRPVDMFPHTPHVEAVALLTHDAATP